ncbi:hypothetical protein ACN38_g7401, partial [Penicillium nordicum]
MDRARSPGKLLNVNLLSQVHPYSAGAKFNRGYILFLVPESAASLGELIAHISGPV